MTFKSPSFSLSGKVAVVTGGNRGIGRSIALGLASAGASVAVLARSEEKNAALSPNSRTSAARRWRYRST